MLRYNVRSTRLLEIVSSIRRNELLMAPYFQRKLVWRDIHKIDLIKTILLGYPFPEIFIAGGDLDIEEMTANQFIVDGQQRLNSIMEFIDDKLQVDGRKYSDLTSVEKENFLKYEMVLIELDLKHNDNRVIEVFKRLNRTFYSLTNIERLSTEYGPSELMLLAKLISKELRTQIEKDPQETEELEFGPIEFDPEIPSDFIEWSKKINVEKFHKLILEEGVFSPYETSRQVHLMFCLNILGTIKFGFFNRNLDKKFIEEYKNQYELEEELIRDLELIATKIIKMRLKSKSIWYNKAVLFSLIIAFYRNKNKLFKQSEKRIKEELEIFEGDIPPDFRLAAKEAVNNRKERLKRDEYLQKIFDKLQ